MSAVESGEPVDGGALTGRALAGRLQYWLAVIFVAGWTVVICAGLFVQFAQWEYPCPLCMIQRMFMALAALGGAYIVRKATAGTITVRDYQVGWGLAIIGCLVGGFASWRHTMLHILPGDPGYGGAVLGLHMYVWAWILFVAGIGAIALVTSFAPVTSSTAPLTPAMRNLGYAAVGFFALIMLVNLVAVFAEAGLHWYLPDDPVRYQLFYDLGILKS